MVRARVFVGNIASGIRTSDLEKAFEKFGEINKCDLKGSFAFVEYNEEEHAKAAIEGMDRKELRGSRLNVEMGGQIKRSKVPRDPHVKFGTVKLHISGIGRNGNAEEFGSLFEEHTTVHQYHIMPNKDVGFVHIDEDNCEKVMEKMDGTSFNGGKMRVGYGQIGPRPQYDRVAPQVCLHVGGVMEDAKEKYLEMKFGMFGSVGEVKFLPDKNIAFIEMQEEYADRCIQYLHGSTFYGKQIKVSYAKRKNNKGSSQESGLDYKRRRDDYARPERSYDRGYDRDIVPEYSAPPPIDFVIDDFMQLSNIRPRVSIPDAYGIEAVVCKRRRLETIHPYERKLLELEGSRDLPTPPPEFLRLLRDRAELKAQCVLYQADLDGHLHLLSTENDTYGFDAPIMPRQSPPYRSERGLSSSYNRRY